MAASLSLMPCFSLAPCFSLVEWYRGFIVWPADKIQENSDILNQLVVHILLMVLSFDVAIEGDMNF